MHDLLGLTPLSWYVGWMCEIVGTNVFVMFRLSDSLGFSTSIEWVMILLIFGNVTYDYWLESLYLAWDAVLEDYGPFDVSKSK